MIDFEKGQAYAGKQDGDDWQYLAALRLNEEIEVYSDDHIDVGEYLGIKLEFPKEAPLRSLWKREITSSICRGRGRNNALLSPDTSVRRNPEKWIP